MPSQDQILEKSEIPADMGFLPAVSEWEILLRKQTPAVQKVHDPLNWIKENEELLYSFKKYAAGLGNAIGLAANQVARNGEHLLMPFFAFIANGSWQIAVNPVVDEAIGQPAELQERCLSWPGETLAALRFGTLYVSYWTEEGVFMERKHITRLEAQVFQHELDHLNGVPERIVDRDYFTFKNETPKVGRNEPCPCGSGKKYKKCCGKA
jgi:peptide deformylase